MTAGCLSSLGQLCSSVHASSSAMETFKCYPDVSKIQKPCISHNACFSGLLVAGGIRASVRRDQFISHNLSQSALKREKALYTVPAVVEREAAATRWWLLLSVARSFALLQETGTGGVSLAAHLCVFPENPHKTVKSRVQAAFTVCRSSWKTIRRETGEKRIPRQTSKPNPKRK